MSQERTRFPIQPQDVRESARSSKDMAVPGGEPPRRGSRKRRDQDKPSIPADRIHHPDESGTD